MIFQKEALIFLRTPALWIQTAMIGVIILIYIYNIRLLPAKSLASLRTELPAITAFCNVAFIAFIVTAAALRFGFPSISMERNALFLILASPFSKRRYIRIKYLTSAIPLGLLALILAGSSCYLFETSAILTITVVTDTLILSLAISSMALMFGSVYGNLNSPDFAEIPSGWGGMIFMVTSTLITAGFLVLQAYPFYIYFLVTSSIFRPEFTENLTVASCLIASALIPLAICIFCIRKAKTSLGNLV